MGQTAGSQGAQSSLQGKSSMPTEAREWPLVGPELHVGNLFQAVW